MGWGGGRAAGAAEGGRGAASKAQGRTRGVGRHCGRALNIGAGRLGTMPGSVHRQQGVASGCAGLGTNTAAGSKLPIASPWSKPEASCPARPTLFSR